MQLTNIIRDVGEDLDRGRVYLPLDRLHAHGLSVRALPASVRGAAAVASNVYAGIHDAVRRMEYDALAARASATAPEQLVLALRALRTA